MADLTQKITGKLVSLRRKKEEQKKMIRPLGDEHDRYPFGSRLSFSDEEVKKLGLEGLTAGKAVGVVGIGTVDSVDVREEEKGKVRHNISIQLKKISVKSKGKKGDKTRK